MRSTSIIRNIMGDKISSEQTFSTKARKQKISCLTRLASPSLDFFIALAITVFKAFILTTLLACKLSSKGFSIFSSNTSYPNVGKNTKELFVFH
jgi:hypothetical protein